MFIMIYEMNNIIETERFVLRDITLDDIEEMFLLHSNSDVQKYTGEPTIESFLSLRKSRLYPK